MPGRCARWRGALLTVAATAVALGALAFCAFGGTAAASPGRAPGTAVVVASFNFPESELLAAIYALALMQAGIPARLQLGLGPREVVQPALAQGLVDVVPEYLGTALTSLEPGTDVAMSDPVAVRHELVRALARWHVKVLQPAAAQDQDGLVVTSTTAARLRLRTVSDLGPLAPQLVLGGAPECAQRPSCLPGLRRVYGLEFARFVPLDTAQERIDALGQGMVDVVVTGTARGYLASGDLVLLADDRRLQPAGQHRASDPRRRGGAVRGAAGRRARCGIGAADHQRPDRPQPADHGLRPERARRGTGLAGAPGHPARARLSRPGGLSPACRHRRRIQSCRQARASPKTAKTWKIPRMPGCPVPLQAAGARPNRDLPRASMMPAIGRLISPGKPAGPAALGPRGQVPGGQRHRAVPDRCCFPLFEH